MTCQIRFWPFVAGMVFVIWGVWTIFERRQPYLGHYIDLGDYHYLVGIFVAILGVDLFVSSFRKRTIEDETGTLICPSCRTPYNKRDLPGMDCPKCDVPLEQFEGFYDRHPENKENTLL